MTLRLGYADKCNIAAVPAEFIGEQMGPTISCEPAVARPLHMSSGNQRRECYLVPGIWGGVREGFTKEA